MFVILLIGCGVIFYIVMRGDTSGEAGPQMPPAGYGNAAGGEDYGNPGVDPSEGEGQASYPGDTHGNAATDDEPDTGNGTAATDDEPDTVNGAADDYNGDASTIVLLTEVDNSLLPWYLKLVNRYNFLDYYFYPQLTYLGVGGGHRFDTRAYRALLDMLESARNDGLDPVIASSFRSVSRQTYLFNRQVQRNIDAGYSEEDAFENARRVVAYPGSSEHNLGLAVDIVSNSYHGLTARQAETPEGIWLAENSWRYGFVLRYPYYQQHITNIIFEPWHFRYVGVYAAAEMFERGLVLEEFVSELLSR